jgi:hypothetical protein
MTNFAIDRDSDGLPVRLGIEPRPKRGRPKTHRHLVPFVSPTPTPESQTKSWWLGKSGEAFRLAQQAEQERMQQSKDGRKPVSVPGDFE